MTVQYFLILYRCVSCPFYFFSLTEVGCCLYSLRFIAWCSLYGCLRLCNYIKSAGVLTATEHVDKVRGVRNMSSRMETFEEFASSAVSSEELNSALHQYDMIINRSHLKLVQQTWRYLSWIWGSHSAVRLGCVAPVSRTSSTISLDNRLTDGGEVVSLTRRSPFTPLQISRTHFCQRLTPGP
jgi:hypothetical protein